MALKLTVDSLDNVPEAVRDLYAKTDDGFRLQVDGVEDPAALKKALKAERDARAEFEKKLKTFDGIDPEEARAILTRFENDEELQLIKKGDTAKLREKWTEKMKADYEKKLAAAQDAVKAESTKSQRWQSRVLDNAVREAATKVGLHVHAVEDALFRARSMFTLDENGNAVQLRDGTVVMGKDGKTPFNPGEWLESMREVAPHWFPASGTGGGSQPASKGGGNTNSKAVKRSVFDAMDPAEKMSFAKAGGVVMD